jgi:hypothetical protein
MILRGQILVLTNKAAEAVKSLTSGLTAYSSTGGSVYVPSMLPYLARAHAELG